MSNVDSIAERIAREIFEATEIVIITEEPRWSIRKTLTPERIKPFVERAIAESQAPKEWYQCRGCGESYAIGVKCDLCELGDGEPSPPCLECGIYHAAADGCDWNTGAAQEVSPPSPQSFDEWWAESRKLNPDCGCEQRGQRWFKCSYHEGADDAWDAKAEGDTRELKAALQTERELRMKIVGFVNDTWLKDRPDVEDDGFGGGAVNPCLECGLRLMEVVRPGKVQCSLCG